MIHVSKSYFGRKTKKTFIGNTSCFRYVGFNNLAKPIRSSKVELRESELRVLECIRTKTSYITLIYIPISGYS